VQYVGLLGLGAPVVSHVTFLGRCSLRARPLLATAYS